MNFRVTDESGKQVAFGRDLTEIKRSLGAMARSVFEALPPTQWHKDNLTRWDFGDLPEQVAALNRAHMALGYPTLLDEGAAVSLRVLDSPAAARAAMRGGLRRLFMIQVGEELKYLSRKLTGLEQMCLHYALLGRCDELKKDLLTAIADAALFDGADDEAAAKKAEALAEAMAPAPPAPEEPAQAKEDEYLEIARGLERGMWVEFENEEGQLAFAKLAWISPLRGTYLFTNRQGQKALSITAEELAEHFRSDRARLVEAEPLIDRAVSNMLQQIEERLPAVA